LRKSSTSVPAEAGETPKFIPTMAMTAVDDDTLAKNDLRDDAIPFSAFRAEETATFVIEAHGANAAVVEMYKRLDRA
jgi:hypothetical protein